MRFKPFRNRSALACTMALVLAAAGYLFFCEALPFGFEDVPFIRDAIDQSYARILADIANPVPGDTALGFRERPVELLVLKTLHAAAGYTPVWFRLFKVACTLGVILLLLRRLRRHIRNPLLLAATGLSVAMAPPVLQSTTWICDFEPLCELFIVGALFAWLRLLTDAVHPRRWALYAVILGCGWLANETKATAVVIPGTILVSGVLLRGRALRPAVALALPLLWLTVAARFGADTAAPALRWANVPALLRQLGLITGWTFPATAVVLCLTAGRRTTARRTRAAAALFAGWLISAILVWPVLPSPETRYLTAAAVPALAGLGLAAALLARRLHGFPRARRVAQVALLLFMAALFGRHLALNTHFRGCWGSNFIAIDTARAYIEDRYEDTLILYAYWRKTFYPAETSRRNTYVPWLEEELRDAAIEYRHVPWHVPARHQRVLFISFLAPSPWHDLADTVVVTGTRHTWFDRCMARQPGFVRGISLLDLSCHAQPGIYPCRLFLGPVRPGVVAPAPAGDPPEPSR